MAIIRKENNRRIPAHLLAVLFVLLAAVLVGPACASAAPADKPAVETEEAAAESSAEAEVVDLAAQWGVEVTSIRMTANDHMIDYRYRVLDADKAADLFKRQIKPFLIHEESGRVLAVPETAKLGPLRNSNIPPEGKIYWMFFGNAGNLVKAGDKVTVVIGEFRVEDLIVE
jgi:hypothetical protein